MTSKIIACDVDLTVVDSLSPWLRWFRSVSNGRDCQNKDGVYDLVPEMKMILAEQGKSHIDPFDFWHDSKLYDDLAPIRGAEIALRMLHEMGNKIIFVSLCQSSHMDSKERFLNKYFPFADGFIATKHKEFVKYDAFVDDKLEHLQLGYKENPNAEHFLITQVSRGYVHYSNDDNIAVMNHWADFPFGDYINV